MTNPYIACKILDKSANTWAWRIECVEGFYDWQGPFNSERAARRSGNAALRRIKARLKGAASPSAG